MGCTTVIASRLAPTGHMPYPEIMNTTNPMWERACSRLAIPVDLDVV